MEFLCSAQAMDMEIWDLWKKDEEAEKEEWGKGGKERKE